MAKRDNYFDYIIVGAGLSGISLAHRLIPHLQNTGKRLLLLDRGLDSYPERTWSFWEAADSIPSGLIEANWLQIRILDETVNIQTPTAPYHYKSIRSTRWRAHYLQIIAAQTQITIIEEAVLDIQQTLDEVSVHTATSSYQTLHLFDSRFAPVLDIPDYVTTLWQQFYGCYIRTKYAALDPNTADLMDFRASQQEHIAFFYMLPSDSHTALVEYTLFTDRPKEFSYFKRQLSDYLDQHFGHGNYEIIREEEGNIPMSSYRFPRRDGRIFYIGTAGGCTKPSTGYTFYYVQQQIHELGRLIEKGYLNTYGRYSWPMRRFHFYDSILLQILSEQPHIGHTIFVRLFRRNPTSRIFKFLNNDTTLWEEIKLFSTLPIGLFSRYAMRILFKHR